jgi:hypothetical protein
MSGIARALRPADPASSPEPSAVAAALAAAPPRCEYKLISAAGLAVGELYALLDRHRRAGWVVAQLLLDDEDRIADIDDLQDLGILLRRERRS